jgi:hypothetical protein
LRCAASQRNSRLEEAAMSDRDSLVSVFSRADRDRSSGVAAQDVHDASKPGTLKKAATSQFIHFGFVYYVVLLLTVLNFFLTKHPYMAMHNPYGFGDDFFFVLSTRIIGFAIVAYFVVCRYVFIDFRIVLICLVCLISGVVTHRIESKFLTYVLLVVALVGTSSMGRHDALMDTARSGIIRSLSWSGLSTWMLGLATMALLPETSGVLFLALSRESRSEITLWHMAGLYAILPCLCLVNILKNPRYSKVIWILIFIAHLFFALITSRRMWIMQTTIPVILGIAFSRSTLAKLMAILAMGCVFLAAFYGGVFDKFIEIFLLATNGSQFSLEDASNGRATLWEYHIECFLRSPIWGNGAYVVDYNRDKESLTFLKAESEIGVMSIYSEYGAVVGLAITAISLVAFFRAVMVLKAAVVAKGEAFLTFLAFFYVTNYGFFIIENNSAVSNLESFVFWYSMMFFFYRRRC